MSIRTSLRKASHLWIIVAFRMDSTPFCHCSCLSDVANEMIHIPQTTIHYHYAPGICLRHKTSDMIA